MDLLKKIYEMELEYVKNFANFIEDEDKITFSDPLLPDMYSHNFIHYKNKDNVFSFISKMIKETESDFLQIEAKFPFSSDVVSLSNKSIVTVYDIYYSDTENYKNIIGNSDCLVIKADNEKILNDGIMVDIEANKDGMGLDFATKRIKRKAKEYNNKNIDLYVIYHNDIPIGNIEYAYANGIVKLEDFDILSDYQRKGYGSYVLKYLLEKAYNDGIEGAYLITDKDDTAKEMYKKCGFKKVGEKNELLMFK